MIGPELVAFLLFGGLGLALAFTFREPGERPEKEQRPDGDDDSEQVQQSQEEASSDTEREDRRAEGWSETDGSEYGWQQNWSDKPRADSNPELDMVRKAREAQQRAAEQAQSQRARERVKQWEQQQRQRQAQEKLKAEQQRVYTVEECRKQVQKHHPDKGGSREQFELWMSRLEKARASNPLG